VTLEIAAIAIMDPSISKPNGVDIPTDARRKAECLFDFLLERGLIDPEDRQLFWYAETAEQIWNEILGWYAQAGKPLFCDDG
jgi:predicted Rossmann-fold nucleotide-binding protein